MRKFQILYEFTQKRIIFTIFSPKHTLLSESIGKYDIKNGNLTTSKMAQMAFQVTEMDFISTIPLIRHKFIDYDVLMINLSFKDVIL